jgi:ComF family protein
VPDAGVIVGDSLCCALAACAYEGPMRGALAALKYTGVRRLADPLADLAVPALERVLAISGPADLVPVPIHAGRRAARGYNQAELIASELARRSGLRVASALERSQATAKQHRLNRVARLANLRGAFTPRSPVPRVAIVVDDIITTSATLEACAAALVEGGAEAVYGVAVAREV